MAYNFAAFVALAPETGELARNTRGQVFAADDGGLTSPLTVTIDGIEVTEIPVGPQGVGTPFTSDEPIVLFKSSGAPAISLASLQHLADAAVAAADDAELSRIAAELAAANAAVPSDEAIRDALAAAISNPESDVSSAVDAGITDQLAARPLPITPEQFGAVGDGVTDDAAALASACASVQSGGVIELGDHLSNSTITVPAGVTLRGGRITTSAGNRMVTLGDGSVLDGVHIDPPGDLLGTMGAVEATGEGAIIRGCRFSSSARAWQLSIQASATNTLITDTAFDRHAVAVFVNSGVDGLTVRNCTFSDWTNRCISLNATTAGYNRIRIQDNEFGPLSTEAAASDPRVALYIRSSQEDYRITDIEISGNRVYGNGLGHSDTSMGPADMLSLHRLDGARIINNYLEDPGEVGIHVGQGSRKVVLSGNTVLRADTTGIVVGEVTNTYRIKDVTATNNIVLDSQWDRIGDLPATVTGGISFWHADGVVATGNRSGNTEGNTTQGYGVKVVDCNGVTLGANDATGARLGDTYIEDSSGVVTTDVNTMERFGAAGDGVTDDSAALVAALAAGDVYLGPKTYAIESTIALTGGARIIGSSIGKSKLVTNSGDLFTATGSFIALTDVSMESAAGGGHVLVVEAGAPALAQSQFTRCDFRQVNAGTPIISFDDPTGLAGGMFDVHWLDCRFIHRNNSTVPAFYINGSGNCFSANRITRSRAQYCDGAPFFEITCNAGSTSNYNNVFDTINFEHANGGGIHLYSATSTGIYNPGFFDNGTITGDLIKVTRKPSTKKSENNSVFNYHRSGGTLSGAVDINNDLGNSSGLTVVGVGGPAPAGITLTLGNGTRSTVVGYDPGAVNINGSEGMLVHSAGIVVNGTLHTAGAADPEGNVSAEEGSIYSRTSGAPGPTLYYKRGSGSTGWRTSSASMAYPASTWQNAGHPVNTNNKIAGAPGYDTTERRPIWAVGGAATSAWVFADGTTAYTPS